MTERETTRTNNGGDATARPDETELTWLAAGWVDLKELEDAHPQVCTDGWPARVRVERQGHLVVEIYCVETWHKGDEYALYCNNFKTGDPPLRWHGSVEKTLTKAGGTASHHQNIEHDAADAPNPKPSLQWNSRMREEEEYVLKNPDTGEPIVDDKDNVTVDEERLEMDAHDAASYTGPAIPDGTDMDAVVEAGYNEIAIRTRRGQLWELCSVGGTILWDDYRGS